MEWVAEDDGGSALFKGKATLRDCASGCSADDLELTTSFAPKNDQHEAVRAFLKKDANNGPTKDNMLRLQNKQRMNMSQFDMQWYALGLESPPSQMGMQMRRAPKGFREPPKKKKGG